MYASLCDFVCIALLLPFVPRLSLSFFYNFFLLFLIFNNFLFFILITILIYLFFLSLFFSPFSSELCG